MNFRYSINAFKTKQVLDKSYQNYALPYETKKWWGEYNKKYDDNTIREILDAFDKNRERYFELIYQSDYRDTYRSKGLGLDIYLKHYRVFEAKYSKTTIYRRNIIRRTLAKKPFALTFKLRELSIPTIESLFYAGMSGNYICTEAIYASIAKHKSVSISYYFSKISQKHHKSLYTENYDEDIQNIHIDEVLKEYGKFLRKLLDAGVRAFYRELFSNTLIHFNKNRFSLLLCDLDIVDTILPYSDEEYSEIIEKTRDHLRHRLETMEINTDISHFDAGISTHKGN